MSSPPRRPDCHILANPTRPNPNSVVANAPHPGYQARDNPVKQRERRADPTGMDSTPVSSKRPAGRTDVDARLAQVEAILAAVAETVSAAAGASERRST